MAKENNLFTSSNSDSYNGVRKTGTSYGGGLGETVPTVPVLEVSNMTCGIMVRNENGNVLAFDTWNHTDRDDHYIRKIAYNKMNKIMIGQIGDNGVYTAHGLVMILDIMQKFCDSFDSRYSGSHLVKLQQATVNFVNSINVGPNYEFAMQQYVVVFHDAFSHRNELRVLEYSIGYVDGAVRVLENRRLEELDCRPYVCMGVNMIRENSRYAHKVFAGKSLSELTRFAYEQVQKQIDEQKYLTDQERTVGGSVELLTMDSDGNIKTYF